MRILTLAEPKAGGLRPASLSCLTFAQEVAAQTGGEAAWLVLGDEVDDLAKEAARYAPVLALKSAALQHPVASVYGGAIARVAKSQGANLITAATSSFAKDIAPRAAALLGGAMVSDILSHKVDGEGLVVDCPRFAGAVTATLRLVGSRQTATIRPSAYEAAKPQSASCPITFIEDEQLAPDRRVRVKSLLSRSSDRPDVTEARVVVSGGRAVNNQEDFERLVGGLADALGGAVGSSRVLVDTGIAPSDLQVGQTGKVVAPDLYIALGISGAVQHLAGMKNSRKIVAINSDPDAPIFDVADYGLVGDIYEIVPELIEKLSKKVSEPVA